MTVCTKHDCAYNVSCPGCTWEYKADAEKDQHVNTKNFLETARREINELKAKENTIDHLREVIRELKKENAELKAEKETLFERKREKLEKSPAYWKELYELSDADLKLAKAENEKLREWKRKANNMLMDVHALTIEDSLSWGADSKECIEYDVDAVIDWEFPVHKQKDRGDG